MSNPTIDKMLQASKADFSKHIQPLRSTSRERQEATDQIPQKLHGTYYSTLSHTIHNNSSFTANQPTVHIEDRENQSFNAKYPQGYNTANNVTQVTANHNDTTVNQTHSHNALDNTYYTNHGGRGDASFLNHNNVSASNYNTVVTTGAPLGQNPSPGKGGAFVGYINA